MDSYNFTIEFNAGKLQVNFTRKLEKTYKNGTMNLRSLVVEEHEILFLALGQMMSTLQFEEETDGAEISK